MTQKTPLTQDLIARASSAWNALLGRSNSKVDAAWMTPGTPVQPMVSAAQQESVRGRVFDFPVGYNYRQQPRSGEAVSFAQMRSLADNCDVLRMVIETRKDQLAKFKFSVGFKDSQAGPATKRKAPDARCKEVEDFFAMPNGEMPWSDWLRMVCEEMLVTDALTIYPWLNNDGTPYRFDVMDGATIKRVIDEHGRTPAAPYPAYQQVLKGMVATEYTVDELVYAPRNRRVHKVYGYSPVEQIIMTVNIAIRRALHQLQYYTEGSTPDLLFQVPPEWNMTQIKEFNEWWQDSLSGNTGARRKAQFVPNGVTPLNTKEAILKDPYDEWLARIICYAFSVSAQPFIKENNRSTSETAHQMALEEGLYPLLNWLKGIMDRLIWNYFGYKDLEFLWDDQESLEPKTQAEIDDINLKNGSVTLNEVRGKRGDAPVEGGDVPMVLTATGYVPIIPKEPEPEPPPSSLDPSGNPGEGDDTDPTQPPPAGAAGGASGAAPATPAAKGAKGPVAAAKSGAKASAEDDTTKFEEGGVGADGTYRRFQRVRKAKTSSVKQIKKNTKADKAMEAAFAKDLHKKLTTQANALIEHVVSIEKAAPAKRTKNPLDEFDWSGWESFEDLFGRHLRAFAKLGVTQAAVQVDVDDEAMIKLANKNAIAYADERAAELVGKRVDGNGNIVDNPNPQYSIEETTREMIRADVTRAMEEGLSNDELAAILKDSYAFSEERSMTIARTESAAADTNGNLELYRSTGQVAKKEWIVGEGCCEECEELDGKVVGLDEEFDDGVFIPPAHPNCRCDYLPVLEED